MENTLNDNFQTRIVADDQVVTMDYTLTVDGEVVDSSEGSEPIEFLQGYGNIVAGLEREIYGMSIGQSKDVTISATDGYGEIDPSAIVEIPRKDFPPEIPVKKGTQLQVKSEDGEILDAAIVAVSKDSVRLDFNHPLAGKELFFHVTIKELRDATEEEIEHGHVHSEEGMEFEEDLAEDVSEGEDEA
jgi:FKBP-type peptidyl-prolyl cis-trans isomerase SlyD